MSSIKLPYKIAVQNFKCFDQEGVLIDEFKPITLIIGKNNSGKSSITEIVEYLITLERSNLTDKTKDQSYRISILYELDSEIIRINEQKIKNSEANFLIRLADENINIATDFSSNFENFSSFFKNDKEFQGDDRTPKIVNSHVLAGFFNEIYRPFKNKKIAKVNAERNIIPEPPSQATSDNFQFKRNCDGITQIIEIFLRDSKRDNKLVEQVFLKEINRILNPEIKFDYIGTHAVSNAHHEIFFRQEDQNRISLSNMGSGIKTIIQILFNLIIRPEIENAKIEDYVFIFEEPENNLHPSIQRRLYEYIIEYTKLYNCQLIVTSHSPIAIDSFSNSEDAGILHVINNSGKVKVNTIAELSGRKSIITDLGIRASDLLQTNGIIWVEGPSDINYIRFWLNFGLWKNEFKENIHYSFMIYGGQASYLSFEEQLETALIPALQINNNAFVVMDRDGDTPETKLSTAKNRVISEIGKHNFWVTKGREIENYIGPEMVTHWLESKLDKKKLNTPFINHMNIRFEENLATAGSTLKYSLAKNKYSREIIEANANRSSITMKSDLTYNIDNIKRAIKKWNS